MAVTAAPLPPQQFGRSRPLLGFALCTGFLGLHHWWAVSQGEIFPKLMLFLFTFAVWSAGGILYPPSFYALTKFGSHLPVPMKALGGLFAAAGFCLGFYVLLNIYS